MRNLVHRQPVGCGGWQWRGSFRARAGFSLVEVMLVTFVIVILSGYAMLAVRGTLARSRLDRAASRFAFQLQQARAEAVATDQNVAVTLDLERGTMTLWRDENRDGEQGDAEVRRLSLLEAGEGTMTSQWTAGSFNAYGQFFEGASPRHLRSYTTTFSAAGGNQELLILHGSGAVSRP